MVLRLLRLWFWLLLALPLLIGCAGSTEPAQVAGGPGERTEPILEWTATNWPQGAAVRAVAIHPQRPQVIFAGLTGQGVYQSSDDGRTWQPRNNGLSNSLIDDLDPSDPARRVRALLISRADPDRLLAGSEGGVFQSTDGGQSWQQMLAPEAWDVQLRTYFARTHALASAPTAQGEVFYLATDAGLFLLPPGAESWQPTSLTGLQPQDAVWAVWVDPADPQIIYAGTAGKGVWVSRAGGEGWTAVDAGLSGAAARTINKLIGDGAGRLWAGTWGDGVYLWQGAGWTPFSTGLPAGARVWSLAFDPAADLLLVGLRDDQTYSRQAEAPWQPSGLTIAAWTLARDAGSNRVYAGSLTDGVLRSADGGKSWEKLPLPGAPLAQTLFFAGHTLFAGTAGSGLYASGDGGATWERRGQGFSPAADQVQALAVAPGEDAVLFAATLGDGVYESRDAGVTWARLAPDSLQHPDPDVTPGAAKQVISLTVLPWQGGYRLFAGAQFGGLFRYDPADGVWVFAQGLAAQAGLGATIASLTVGPDGFLYAAVHGAGIFRSEDGGESWQVVSREALFARELVAAPRRGLQSWFHGPDRLYARTFDGVYGSSVRYPGTVGVNWQRLISGSFGAVAADPAHPQLAYLSVLTTTLASPMVTPTFASLISLDNGRTWQEAGPVAAPIRALAAHPAQKGVLFAAAGDGMYRGQVRYPLLWREIAAWLALLAPLLLALALLAYAYLALARPYALPLPTALHLLLLRRRQLALVLAEPTALSPLEQLILAEADRPPWLPQTMMAALAGRQAHANNAQIAAALDRLSARLGLLRGDAQGRYRLTAAALGRILRRRTQAEAQRLAKAVREENSVYLEARDFFRGAGLAVFARGDVLLLQAAAGAAPPGLAPLAGPDHTFMARLVANRRPTAAEVDAAAAAAADAYNRQLRQRIAFLMVVEPPDASVYQRIAAVQAETGLQIVLISHAAIHRSLGDGTISAALHMALRRARGELNAGLLAGPIFDPLDFFNRQDWLANLTARLAAGQTLLLAGPPQIGKSSLAWQAVQALTDHIVAYARVDSRDAAGSALGRDLVAGLLADGARKYPQIEWPLRNAEGTSGSVAAAMQQIDALIESLRSQTAAPRLALIIDDLNEGGQAAWQAWQTAAAARPEIGLLGILQGQGQGDWRPEPPLLPFTLAETAAATAILAAQSHVTLAPEGVIETLHSQSGGHPLLVRQIFGLAATPVSPAAGGEGMLDAAHIFAAAAAHIRISPLYGRWWQGWSEAERGLLLALAGGETPGPDLAPAAAALTAWGWIEPAERGHRIVAQALADWVRWAILLTAA